MTELDLLIQYRDGLGMVGAILVFVIAPAIYLLPVDENRWTKRKPAVEFCKLHSRPLNECLHQHKD